MSNNPPYYSPDLSTDLFDSTTGELIFSIVKNPIYKNSTFDFIKEEVYENQKIRDCAAQKKLSSFVDALIAKDVHIKINTPPHPSPDFLPNIYFQQKFNPEIDLSQFEDFEDFIQKNMNTKTSLDNENFKPSASVGNEYKNSLIPPDVYAKYIKENPQFYPSYHFSKF